MLLEMKGITKQFPGTRALNQVDFSVDRGQIVALMGENGAGKSTLMKILAGIHQKDAGTILIDGEEQDFTDPIHAQKHGVAIVHQELSIFPHLSIAENVLSNREPVKGGIVQKRELQKRAKAVLSELGVDIDVRLPAGSLSTSQQQLVEIARAISMDPSILIMDEPTSSLSDKEIDILLNILRDLRAKGLGIIYISHKIQEVLTIADSITVLRDSENSGELSAADADEHKIVSLMVGRESYFVFPPKADDKPGEVLLRISHLKSLNMVKDVSFEVEKGKILGVFGLMGAGRTETARAIFGLAPYEGEIEMEGKKLKVRIPKDAMDAGIAYLPEDRKKDGLFLEMSVQDNIVASILDHVSSRGIVKNKAIKEHADSMISQFQAKVSDPKQKVGSLSGGNQQKILIAKYYESDPKVLIIDEPTRGIDVGAKSEIHRQLRELANAGHAVVVISSELLEVLGLSDRVVVICGGRSTGELKGDDMTEHKVMELATKFAVDEQEVV